MYVNQLDSKEYKKLRQKIIKKLEKNLTPGRFEHTLQVEQVALDMASIYGAEHRLVSMAALFHDYAKKYDNEKKRRLVHKYHIVLNEAELRNIDLVHGRLGAAIARDKYQIEDKDIHNASIYHTTGRENMSLVEKVIYIADFIEPGRKPFPGLDKARELAYTNIDEAMVKILMMTLNHIIDKGYVIDQRTEQAYEYYYKLYNKEHRKKD
jgi:predicted HD superfamily hydrolase involved in NAD metabolism